MVTRPYLVGLQRRYAESMEVCCLVVLERESSLGTLIMRGPSQLSRSLQALRQLLGFRKWREWAISSAGCVWRMLIEVQKLSLHGGSSNVQVS